MKVAVQSHMRDNAQLDHEFNKIIEAGHKPVSYGYFIDHENRTVKIVGLEEIPLDEFVFNRASVQILRYRFVLKYDFIGHIPKGFLESLVYDLNGFDIRNMPENPIMINKVPGKYSFMLLDLALTNPNFKTTFYKPILDLKLITGTVVQEGQHLSDIVGTREHFSDRALGSMMLVSENIVKLKREIRCFVVDNKVITCGQYKKDDKYNIEHLTETEENYFIGVAQMLLSQYYSPAKNCTIDIGLIDDVTPVVIEYNCLNTSGMYNINSGKLFKALEKQFNI